jgi:small subunit ribosomal protein S27e
MAGFIKLICEKCKNEQVVYSRSASKVECLVCGQVVALPTGGKASVKVKIVGPVK